MYLNNTHSYANKFASDKEAIDYAISNNYNVVVHWNKGVQQYYFGNRTQKQLDYSRKRCGDTNGTTWIINSAPISVKPSIKPLDQNWILDRLITRDERLFKYEVEDASRNKLYSRQCQQFRQPYILTSEKYLKIKDLYGDKVCWIEKIIDPQILKNESKQIWTVVRAGSDKDHIHYYMGAQYWCVYDDIPLINSEIENTKSCFLCGGTLIQNERYPKEGETVVYREQAKYAGYLEVGSHPDNYALPACFREPLKHITPPEGSIIP